MTDNQSDERSKARRSTMQAFADAMRQFAPYMHLPYQMIASILLFFGAGYAIDKWTDNWPAFTVAGSVLGVIVGMFAFIKTALELTAKTPKKQNEKNAP